MTPIDMSAELRRRALDMPPLNGGESEEPYGLVTEFVQGQTVVTLAAFATGDASLYFSTGGGIIGGIGKRALAELARTTVESLAPLVAQLERSDATDPPQPGEFCFYVLTPGGRRICRVRASGTAPANGPEVKLIRLGGALLTKVRESST
jgi:hypothetical protein